jgi:hypothetical protein
MAKDMTTYPVSKGKSKKLFGYADAGQIARSNGKLVLFDPDKADKIKIEQAVAIETAKVADEDAKVAEAKNSGGADASAVKKAPPTK